MRVGRHATLLSSGRRGWAPAAQRVPLPATATGRQKGWHAEREGARRAARTLESLGAAALQCQQRMGCLQHDGSLEPGCVGQLWEAIGRGSACLAPARGANTHSGCTRQGAMPMHARVLGFPLTRVEDSLIPTCALMPSTPDHDRAAPLIDQGRRRLN